MAQHSIHTHIDIDAPPIRIWAILTNFSAMPSWNPFIRSIEGELKPGAHLLAQIGPPGKSAMNFRPRVLVVQPERELRWKGMFILPYLADGEHYFQLEPIESATRLTHGELFTGILVGWMRGALSATEDGIRAMNLALKERAESM